MSIIWLNPNSTDFPDPAHALREPDGLLAAGGDLSVKRLLSAYQSGIFPWYSETLDDGSPSPILWWSPDPRCVLYTHELKISKSLRKSMRNKNFKLSCNLAFRETIEQCANKRADTEGTWINQDMIRAYKTLHRHGHAHSVECWQNEVLVGGLYGVCIGKMFFGESMFSSVSDSSKAAFTYLCYLLNQQGSTVIDCQISNPHLESLGAREIPLSGFLSEVKLHCQQEALIFPEAIVDAFEIEKKLNSIC